MPASSGDQAIKVSLFLCPRVSFKVFCKSPASGICIPVTLARRQAVLEVIDGVSGTLAGGTLCIHQQDKSREQEQVYSAVGANRTVLDTAWAFRSFSRKVSQSLLSLISSTTISLRSSDSLKMMYLCFLLSLRSFQAETHSSLTVALHVDFGWLVLAQSSWPVAYQSRFASSARKVLEDEAVVR